MHDETKCLKVPAANGAFASLSVPVHRASTIVFDSVDAYQNRHHRLPIERLRLPRHTGE